MWLRCLSTRGDNGEENKTGLQRQRERQTKRGREIGERERERERERRTGAWQESPSFGWVKLGCYTAKSYIQRQDETTGKLKCVLNVQGPWHKELAKVFFDYILEHQTTREELESWKKESVRERVKRE